MTGEYMHTTSKERYSTIIVWKVKNQLWFVFSSVWINNCSNSTSAIKLDSKKNTNDVTKGSHHVLPHFSLSERWMILCDNEANWSNFLQADLKVFFYHHLGKSKLVFERCYFMGHTYSFMVPTSVVYNKQSDRVSQQFLFARNSLLLHRDNLSDYLP